MWIDKHGYVYTGDRQGSDPAAPPKTENSIWDKDTQSWQPMPQTETELEVVQQAAQFILDNLVVPVEKQTERDQLKTKLNTKRTISS